MKLYYNTPATRWDQGLPIGNGRVGVMICSGYDMETWRVTDSTFWSGKSDEIRGFGCSGLDSVREKFLEGDYSSGDELASKYLEPEKKNYGTNLTTFVAKFKYDQPSERLSRTLDLTTAVATINDDREIFASNVDNVLVAKIRGSFSLEIDGIQGKVKREGKEGLFSFETQAFEDIHSDGKCGVFAKTGIQVTSNGECKLVKDCHGTKIQVGNATETVVIFAVKTDYKGSCTDFRKSLELACAKPYNQLKADHIEDFSDIFNRVSLDLGLPKDPQYTQPIDEWKKSPDPALDALYYQYARYLTIASSRENSPLPMNLQAVWNDGEANAMNWSCDYHLDINTQMNYWCTESAALSGCHEPLMRYIEQLSKDGTAAAREFYGCDGWVAHVFSNVWGFTSPGWKTDWGLNVTGGLWIATHMIEHYEYSQENTFLQERALPVLIGAAEFFMEYMCKYNGYLVTGPSPSPENSFMIGGKEHHLSMGPTIDIVLVRDLFEFITTHVPEHALVPKIRHALEKLPPLQVSKRTGELMEWIHDFHGAQPGHRHLSHTIALCRSNQILPGTRLASAVRKTLENRRSKTDIEDIEFTAAMFGCNFARLHDGDNALIHLRHLITDLSFDNLLSYSKPGVAGAEKSIFVVDGNMGGAAVVGEMLLQSHLGVIHLLPALPNDWKQGSVKGLKARGGITVHIEWSKSQLVKANIYSNNPNKAVAICYQNQERTFTIQRSVCEITAKDFGITVPSS